MVFIVLSDMSLGTAFCWCRLFQHSLHFMFCFSFYLRQGGNVFVLFVGLHVGSEDYSISCG